MSKPYERLALQMGLPQQEQMPPNESPQLMRFPTRYPWFIAGIGLAFLAYLLFLQTRSDVLANGGLRAISDVFVLVGAVVGAISCARTAWQMYQAPPRDSDRVLWRRSALGWAFVGGAALAYALGQVIWTGY